MEQILISQKPISYYLESPVRAKVIPPTELKDLLARYPYSEHLHMLHLVQDYLTTGSIDDGLLHQASASAQDPRQLAGLLARIAKDVVDGRNEAEPRNRDSDEQPNTGSAGTKTDVASVTPPIYLERKGDEPKVLKTTILPEPKPAKPTTKKKKSHKKKKKRKRLKKSRLTKALKDLKQQEVAAGKARDVDAFVQWLHKLESLANSPTKVAMKKSRSSKKKKTKKRKDKKNQFGDTPISETLADLLVQQGRQKEAIQMYEALGLKYPEKSSFFAAKIRDLAN